MPDSIRQHDEVPGGIQQLTGAEQDVGEIRYEKLSTAAACTVKNQYGVVCMPVSILVWTTESSIMQAQFGKRISRSEVKVASDIISLFDRGDHLTDSRLCGKRSGNGYDSLNQERHAHLCVHAGATWLAYHVLRIWLLAS